MKILRKFIEYFIIGIKTILNSKITPAVISIITFIFVSLLVYKSITLRNRIDTIENNIITKMETAVKIDYPDYNITSKEGALYISDCLKSPLTNNELTNNLFNIQNELENIFNESDYNFAFKYKDLYTGFTLSYNSSQPIFAASTIKAPEAIYIYKEAEKENIDLNDTITYTSNYYNTGTGILKKTNFNLKYKISQLVEYSIVYSDNSAHLMLNNKYKSSNMYNYWKRLGTTNIFNQNNAWGNINADDATIYMEELYNYYINENKYNNELLSYFDKSWKIISTPNNNIRIANKTGWSDSSLHDTALIFDENPYTLTILTQRGYTEYQNFFDKVSKLIYNYHKEYWKTKKEICKI